MPTRVPTLLMSLSYCVLRGSVSSLLHTICVKSNNQTFFSLFFSSNFLPPYSATSTFWIANPNNNLINCAAAGSEVSSSRCRFTFSSPFLHQPPLPPFPPSTPASHLSPGGSLSHYHIARSD